MVTLSAAIAMILSVVIMFWLLKKIIEYGIVLMKKEMSGIPQRAFLSFFIGCVVTYGIQEETALEPNTTVWWILLILFVALPFALLTYLVNRSPSIEDRNRKKAPTKAELLGERACPKCHKQYKEINYLQYVPSSKKVNYNNVIDVEIREIYNDYTNEWETVKIPVHEETKEGGYYICSRGHKYSEWHFGLR